MRYLYQYCFPAVFWFFIVLVGAVSLQQPVMARSEAIVAVVNEDVVTRSDFQDRMRMVMISSGLPNQPDVREKLAGQVISSLVDEQLRLQEAKRLEFLASAEEIANGFATIAQQNNMEPEKFRAALRQSGINMATMERQIESQILWSKLIQATMRPKVIVSDRDVENFQERLRSSIGTQEYLSAEIFLPVDDPKKERKIKQLAEKLVSQINSGQAPFFRVAQQFSKAAGAAQGGDIGWIQEGQLPSELDEVIRAMDKGTISKPIRTLSGYHILYLRDLRKITEETIPARDKVMNIIGTQRMERLQRRYFLDLKAAAFIEIRV